MIQRVQTVYMILASIFLVIFLLVPSISIMEAGEKPHVWMPKEDNILLAIGIISCVVGFANIFLFKNRHLQIKTEYLVVVLIIIIIGFLAKKYLQLNSVETTTAEILFGAIAPFVSLILHILAINGIRKDEKLIKSLDRLR